MPHNYFLNIKSYTVHFRPENNDAFISKHISDASMWNSITLSFLGKDKKNYFFFEVEIFSVIIIQASLLTIFLGFCFKICL